MVRICILLSGRIKQYKGLLNMIKKSKDNIDVFASINDVDSEFYDNFRNDFRGYLRGIHFELYKIPSFFYTNCNYNRRLGNKFPNVLSCYYNNMIVLRMATLYADTNNFEYDIYLRFRSDIEADTLPIFDDRYKKGMLFCGRPPVDRFKLAVTDDPTLEFKDGREYCMGDIKNLDAEITADIAYGNRNAMLIYCSSYDYILRENQKYKGNYLIWFENCITMCINDSNYPFELFEYEYKYTDNRF